MTGGVVIHATTAAECLHCCEVSECGPPSRGESTSHIPLSTRRLLIATGALDAFGSNRHTFTSTPGVVHLSH